jgi:hypothetical protein
MVINHDAETMRRSGRRGIGNEDRIRSTSETQRDFQEQQEDQSQGHDAESMGGHLFHYEHITVGSRRGKRVTDSRVIEMHKLLEQIRSDPDLLQLEELGFRRGDERGKTMDVGLDDLYHSLQKQMDDVQETYRDFDIYKHPEARKIVHGQVLKSLADLRNVAGCLFLKLVEVVEEDLKREKSFVCKDCEFPEKFD